MVFHQNPEAASGAPISSKDNQAHSANTNSHTESSKDDPAHPANTIMSLNLLNPDPLPNSMTEIEEKGYSLQVETSLAAHTVRDTVPETNPKTTNEAGTNLVIQENGIQHSLEMNLPNSDPLPNSMTKKEETCGIVTKESGRIRVRFKNHVIWGDQETWGEFWPVQLKMEWFGSLR